MWSQRVYQSIDSWLLWTTDGQFLQVLVLATMTGCQEFALTASFGNKIGWVIRAVVWTSHVFCQFARISREMTRVYVVGEKYYRNSIFASLFGCGFQAKARVCVASEVVDIMKYKCIKKMWSDNLLFYTSGYVIICYQERHIRNVQLFSSSS